MPEAAETSTTATPQHAEAPADSGKAVPDALHTQVADLFGSLRRMADLQIGIWLARVKSAILRIVIFLVLALVTLLLLLGAAIWIYAGLYHVLTDWFHLSTASALLIFGGIHLLSAAILGAIAVAILKGPKGRKKPGEGTP